jgi:hypothetical protein
LLSALAIIKLDARRSAISSDITAHLSALI